MLCAIGLTMNERAHGVGLPVSLLQAVLSSASLPRFFIHSRGTKKVPLPLLLSTFTY